MKHTECKDCELHNGDCGNHFEMDGTTNFDIASLSACDKYGNCMFFKLKANPSGDLISREDLKKHAQKLLVGESINTYFGINLYKMFEEIIDNAPTVEETEKPFITECRDAAIEKNLPLYFVYYEETGVFEVYITATKELFEKRHCSKRLSNAEFGDIATRYLDEYSDWRYEERLQDSGSFHTEER